MRFGVHLPTHGEYGYAEILKVSLVADELGFSSLWIGDHFYLPREFYEKTGWDPDKPNKLDAWTLLSALAVQTKSIRLGARVSPLPFYEPARLAKIVATVDVISGGRVNFGVGAGWFRDEAVSYGVYWGGHKERLSRTLEALEVILRLWAEDGRVTYRVGTIGSLRRRSGPNPSRSPIRRYGSAALLKQYLRLQLNTVMGFYPFQTSQLKILEGWHPILMRCRRSWENGFYWLPHLHTQMV
jgi:alkanesulfonate monooxygenase SsuD/methylene tetrahydromethanopterin reductase-like flavin-dependent oxidoreductase (luciferase family)